MNTSGNQLHMETERKLREALLFYMEQEKAPTVGQLCQRAQINRSTFYRHYTDVYDLMNRVEQEFQHGLYRSLDGDSAFLPRLSAKVCHQRGQQGLSKILAKPGTAAVSVPWRAK